MEGLVGIRNWIRNWLNKEDCNINITKCSPSISPTHDLDHTGLNITLYTANGGHVVRFRRYDAKADRHHTSLYIITSDQNFEEALAQTIAMERLSR